MRTVTLRDKKDLGNGDFEYIFDCFSSSRSLKEIKVASRNDDEAKELAQTECNEYSGTDTVNDDRSDLIFKGRRLSIDEFLKEHGNPAVNATLEAIPNNPEAVRITPWVESTGCLCQAGIDVSKASITHLVSTGRQSACCGKTLPVMEVYFRDDISIPLNEFLPKLAAAVRPHQSLLRDPRDPHLLGIYRPVSDGPSSNTRFHSFIRPRFAGMAVSLFDSPWDYEETIQVEGSHLHADRNENCVTKTYELHKTARYVAWDQEVLKADKDTHWEFHRYSDQMIEWNVCAQNCTFSCDEIWLKIKWRVAPV